MNENINLITMGMTPQEKEIYFSHMEKRHREEMEKVQAERVRLRAYKESLIEDILKGTNKYTAEELKKKTIRTLEYLIF